jgi:hypothetical protein
MRTIKTMATTYTLVKRCNKCGRIHSMEATLCSKCGLILFKREDKKDG